MENHEQKILKREDRLLKNEKSWRRSRGLATFIFFFLLFGLLLLVAIPVVDKESPISKNGRIEGLIVPAFFACLFWLLVIDWVNIRLWHIDSINLYRKKFQQQQQPE
jgi:hypothetical protein